MGLCFVHVGEVSAYDWLFLKTLLPSSYARLRVEASFEGSLRVIILLEQSKFIIILPFLDIVFIVLLIWRVGSINLPTVGLRVGGEKDEVTCTPLSSY
jgi:hypothetical protein